MTISVLAHDHTCMIASVVQKIFAEENFANVIMVAITSMQFLMQDKKFA